MTTPRTPVEPPSYRLEHEPDGRSWTVRENLADILERELLGPANGPEEVIDGSPDSVYLIGRIAPVKLTAGKDDPTDADTGEPDTDVGDAKDADLDRGVPLTGVDDSGAGADEDSGVDDEPQQRGLMIPASMGLRCQIPDDLESFAVTASWGVYESVSDKDPERQRVVRQYQRTPIEITKRITLANLRKAATTEIPLEDKVVLRVDRHDDPERGCRLIEIALCNDRETPRKIPVDAWLYQTKLTVSGGWRGGVPAGQRPAAGHPPRAGRRTAAAEPAVPGPARVRGRAYLLGRLGRCRRGAAGQQGVDDVAAGVRDAAGRRRRDRRHARHAGTGDGEPGAAQGRAVADRRPVRGVARRRGGAGPGSCRNTCAARAWTRSARRGRCTASSRTASSICSRTPARCGASGS